MKTETEIKNRLEAINNRIYQLDTEKRNLQFEKFKLATFDVEDERHLELLFEMKDDSPLLEQTIKYRGKSNKDANWIYGGISIFNGEATMFDENEINNPASEVDLKSVGQFTGFKDQMGEEIYVGDIMVGCFLGGFGAVVIFHNGCFCLKALSKRTKCIRLFGEQPHAVKRGYVIGNIYDNPELV